MYEIEYYTDTKGRPIVDDWLMDLSDRKAEQRITKRLLRIKENGGFGDCKFVGGGVWELRVDYGPGYRVYYAMIGKTVVLLLCGGDKRRQDSDIKKAVQYLETYKQRNGL